MNRLIQKFSLAFVAIGLLMPVFVFAREDSRDTKSVVDKRDHEEVAENYDSESREAKPVKNVAETPREIVEVAKEKRDLVNKIIEYYRQQADKNNESELSNWSVRTLRAKSEQELIEVAKEIKEARVRDVKTERLRKASEQALLKIDKRLTVLDKQLILISDRAKTRAKTPEQAVNIQSEITDIQLQVVSVRDQISELKKSSSPIAAIAIQKLSKQVDTIALKFKILAASKQ